MTFFYKRFISNLCVPMFEVILLAIIDNLKGNDNKVFKINNKMLSIPETKERRWWERASVWMAIAKVGLPVAYVLFALAIVVPGIINIMVEGSH